MIDRFAFSTLAALVLVTTACEPLPDTAGGSVYLATNKRQVVPLSAADQFEVIGQAGDWGKEYFCAAGDYATTKLNARASDRVVLVAPVGEAITRNGTSAVFRLAPSDTSESLLPTGPSLDMRRTGENRSVANARFFCESQRSPFR